MGIVAKRFPDVKFLIYHSGFVTTVKEQAYEHKQRRDGIDTLIRSLLDNGIAPNSNVYAELGSTWRFLMREPEQAAHALGKLIRTCGEDNVLWGTDSIWYGSPQDQIQAFRTFQIAPALRDKHGYPAMMPALRAKIFGLNAARVYGVTPAVRRASDEREPHFMTYGPKTRRQFLQLRGLGLVKIGDGARIRSGSVPEFSRVCPLPPRARSTRHRIRFSSAGRSRRRAWRGSSRRRHR